MAERWCSFKEIYEEKSLPKLDTQRNLKIDEAEASRNCFRPEPPAASFSRLTLQNASTGCFCLGQFFLYFYETLYGDLDFRN